LTTASADRRPSIALLSAVSALSSFAMAVCVPALPSIAKAFGAPYARAQLVVSVYLFGLGIAQPIQGPLSDRFGRRRVLLASFGVFVVASLLCAIAPSIGTLLACRFVQALGVSAGTVAGRAMVRDLYGMEDAARVLSYITTAMSLAPAIAPPIGGLLMQPLGWRAPFALAAALGALVWALVRTRLAETRRHPLVDVRGLRHDVASLLRSSRFLGYSLIFGCSNGAFFAFLAIAPSVSERELRVSPTGFGLFWTGLSLAYMTGAWAGTRLVPRLGTGRALRFAVGGVLAAGATYPLLVRALPFGAVVMLAPMALILLGAGVANPIALAGAVSENPRIAGTASGLSSAIAMASSGLFSVGLVPGGTPMAMAASVALAALGVGVAFAFVAQPLRRAHA